MEEEVQEKKSEREKEDEKKNWRKYTRAGASPSGYTVRGGRGARACLIGICAREEENEIPTSLNELLEERKRRESRSRAVQKSY